MKKILFILLLIIPFVGFGQDLSNTVWEIWEEDGNQYIVNFHNNGTFSYIDVTSVGGISGKTYSDDDDTWYLRENNITISHNDGFQILEGIIKFEKNFMKGNHSNKEGSKGVWFGRKIH